MTPDRLVSPTVGLIPTTELSTDGQIMEPAVSDPSVTAAMFAAAATPGPALDPHGVAGENIWILHEFTKTCDFRFKQGH